MSPTFFNPFPGDRHALRGVNAPRCLLPRHAPGAGEAPDMRHVDLLLDHGRIAAVEPAGTLPAHLGPDLDGAMVLPGMPDCHAHLDKGHIWPRRPNPAGDLPSAVAATGLDRVARWTPDDLRLRMEFGLASAYAHGVVAIRTHLDSQAPQAAISFPVFAEMRARWAGRIDLQVSSIAPLDLFLEDEGRALADTVAATGGQLGCATRFARRPDTPAALDAALATLFALAAERGLDLDLHVDESSDPASRALIRVARTAIRTRFPNRILCGHCCALALQDDEFIEATLAACLETRIDIVSLPTVNLYLQDRVPGRTPRWRGVTLLHEMKARGLRVAVAGDNCRDPFHAHGDHDMLDTYVQAVKICHLDAPAGDWIRAATAIPAAIMGLARGRLEPGAPADLLVLKARNASELLARHSSDRVVLRAGRPIDTTLPDFRQLDAAMGPTA